MELSYDAPMLRFAGLLALITAAAAASDLARRAPDSTTHWVSFENPSGAKGQAARENRGAKGHAFDSLKAGETKTLLNVQGAGCVRRSSQRPAIYPTMPSAR